MLFRSLLISMTVLVFLSCAKNKQVYNPSEIKDPFKIYQEAYEAFEINDFFNAASKFSEAELNFTNINLAGKSAVMACFSLYSINFYDEALESIERFLKTYPADENVIYIEYLKAVIFFEQMGDEKKDIKPLIDANNQIAYFIKKYPQSDYAIDLKFKKDLIQNQLAAKELFIAKYYISVQKWIPAINRLKNIVNNYDKTIFIEEALHRLVEVHYFLGLEDEAKKYAGILGYNYNSSEWFKQSYKIFNKNYKEKTPKKIKKEKKGVISKFKKLFD